MVPEWIEVTRPLPMERSGGMNIDVRLRKAGFLGELNSIPGLALLVGWLPVLGDMGMCIGKWEPS